MSGGGSFETIEHFVCHVHAEAHADMFHKLTLSLTAQLLACVKKPGMGIWN